MTDKDHENPQKNQDTSDKLPISSLNEINSDLGHIPEKQEGPGEYESSRNVSKYARAQTWFAGMLVLIAAIQALIYFWTMQEIERQANAADSTISQNRRSIAVAESSLSLAKINADSSLSITRRSAERSEQLARLGLRAWVGFGQIGNVEILTGTRSGFSLPIFNAGQTPAFNVIFTWGDAVTDKVETDIETDYAKLARNNLRHLPTDTRYFTLAPGDTVHTFIKSRHVFNARQVGLMNTGDITYDVMTEIVYEDIFGVRHFTRLHLRYDPEARVFRIAGRFNRYD
jgi:hypothetical protein